MAADPLAHFASLSISGKTNHDFPIESLPKVARADPVSNVLDIFRILISDQVAKLTGAPIDLVYSSVEEPKNRDLADLAIPTPRLRIKGNPVQITQDVIAKFQTDDYIVEKIASGPFMNFRINPAILRTLVLSKIRKSGQNYGTNKMGEGKKAIVEFSSPNIAKPFHAGHLRSTIIGNFVRNVLKANGWQTTAINYLGDWGKQYGLLAVGFGKFGSEEELQKDPIRHLFDVYVKINKAADEEGSDIHDQARAYFKKMEDGDKEALALWQRFRDLSIVKYKETYARLGIEFDVYSGESQVSKEMDEALKVLQEKNLLEEHNGAQIIDLKKDKMGVVVVTKKDGTTLYITRDIGAAKARKGAYNFDAMHYIVGTQQDLHFRQLFKILDLMGYPWAKQCNHINFGMINGMSTRKGTVVFLEDILNHTQEYALEVMKRNEEKFSQIAEPIKVADLVAQSAIFVQDLSSRRVKDYAFCWERMLSFEGDTGPYLQYAHARLCSIERKAEMEVPDLADLDLSVLSEPVVQPLVTLLAQFPDLVRSIPEAGFEPCNVVTYLFRVCHAVSSVLEQLYVLNQEPDVKKARFLLYWATRVTLGNALRLIGLRPLERM